MRCAQNAIDAGVLYVRQGVQHDVALQTPQCGRQKLPPADAAHQRCLLIDTAIGAGFSQRYSLY